MDDLISRQEAIDIIEAGRLTKLIDAETAVNGLKGLPSAQPEQKWIPCSERCPKENGYYLTSTINKEVYCDYWSYDHFDRTEAVIAWMRLPDPYREGDTK